MCAVVINALFERMERYHGRVFTSHALSYLTASKSGLSDVEMEDVLSLDDEVRPNDVLTKTTILNVEPVDFQCSFHACCCLAGAE